MARVAFRRFALPLLRSSAVVFAASVLILSTASAQEGNQKETWHWKSQRLSPLFYSEGGNAADLDGDGHMDIIAGPVLFWGPEFKESIPLYDATPFSINGYSKSFFSFDYDVDRDGLLDVVSIGFPGQAAHWYKNPGKQEARRGNWKQFLILDSVDNESPMFTDVDGDGIPDMVCCHQGNFGYATIPSDPTQPWMFKAVGKDGKYQRFTHGLGVGDVNDDGRNDILSKDGWWEQPAAPTDSPWEFHPFSFSGPGGAQMYAIDFDGDGKTEVVTSLAAHGYGLVVYKKKNGSPSDWERIRIMTDKVETSPTGLAISQLHAIDIADMDGDGKPDIITGKRFWAHNGNDRGENEPPLLVWFKPMNSPSGLRFIPNIVDDNSGVGTQIVAKDINGDGRLDLISVSKRGVHVLTQTTEPPAADPHTGVAPMVLPIDDALGGFRPAWDDKTPMNFDFETGDLRDWTASGGAFFNQPIRGDTVVARRKDMTSNHQGEYWIGSFEVGNDVAMGTMQSKPFKLVHPWVSFLQASGGVGIDARVEIVDATTNKVLVDSIGATTETMKRAVHDVSKFVGKDVFIRLIDNHSGGWGHVNFDDFRLHAEEPNLPPADRLPVFDKLMYQSLPPDQVAAAMTLPEGFSVQVIAAEPDVRQPIAMTIDAKGRVWVAEAYQYPTRAQGDVGKDRVLIFEDTDGDGVLDKHKVFVDNLNLVSGIEVGMGGLWVGAAPYLLFIPDANGDDIPDGPAVKKLTGWGYQDTHETLNSFIWGPDGWLYGCHGVFTHSNVRVVKGTEVETDAGPGTRINAGIWRYHPQTERFEVFAHGTSNPWGVDFNDTGDTFLTACVIPHLYHIIPNGRYQRQAGQHFNPFTYADIQTIAKHRHWVGANPHSGNNRSDSAGGGHAHSGAMFYLGGSWPEQYRNQLLMNNIHGARLNQDQITPAGSGYVGDRAPDFLLANDKSSQILYFRYGPDGQVIAIDWYDAQQCHVNDPAAHDQSNGRIYRISYNDTKPVSVDLEKASDAQLVRYQLDKNDWYVRTARRILMEREAQGKLSDEAVTELGKLTTHAEPRIRLRAYWALAACRRLQPADVERSLKDQDPHVRGWGIRWVTQWEANGIVGTNLPEKISSSLARLAKEDPSPIVRLELASACQSLPVDTAYPIVQGLVSHSEDSRDHNLPLMVWYGLSRQIEQNPSSSLLLLKDCKIELVAQFAAKQVTQMWVADNGAKNSQAFVDLLQQVVSASTPEQLAPALDAVLQGLEGKRTVSAPPGWDAISAKLLLHPSAAVQQRGAQLASKLNDQNALELLRKTTLSQSAADDQRIAALNVLKQVKAEGLARIAFSLLDKPSLRGAALSAIADSIDADGANKVLAIACQWEDLTERRQAWYALLRRATTAEVLLRAIEQKKLPAGELSADMVQQMQGLESQPLNELISQVWGDVRSLNADKQKEVEKIRALVENPKSLPDFSKGKEVFAKVCGQCHVLFGEGGRIGPELTGSNRRDLNYLLENIMDPSAVMAKEYQPWIVQTHDDQVVTGLLKESTPNSMKLQTATDVVVIYNDDIAQKKQSKLSMMPSDLLTPLSDAEVQALFGYLRLDGKR